MLYEDINGDSEEKAVTKKALFEMINTVFDGIQRACKLYDGVKFNNFSVSDQEVYRAVSARFLY